MIVNDYPWHTFLTRWKWKQGEHLTVIGPTGTGKSFLLRAITPIRERSHGAICVIGTKPKDDTLDKWIREAHLTTIKKWPAPYWKYPHAQPADVSWRYRLALRPPIEGAEDLPRMADTIARMLKSAYCDGNWCIFADELWMICDELGLHREMKLLWTQGRSLGVTVAGGTQRPRDIPLAAYSSATHLFFFRTNDEDDLNRIQGIGGMDSRGLRQLVAGLGKHDMLYVNARTKELARTRVTRTLRKVVA